MSLLRNLMLFSHTYNSRQDLRKQSWSTQLSLHQGVSVSHQNPIQAFHMRVSRIKIHMKTVTELSLEFPSKSEHRYSFRWIIIQQNLTNWPQGALVVIEAILIQKVQRVPLTRVSIRSSEVYCDYEFNLTTTSYIVYKRVLLSNIQVFLSVVYPNSFCVFASRLFLRLLWIIQSVFLSMSKHYLNSHGFH